MSNQPPQRTPMKKRSTRMILELTAKRPYSTAELYEKMSRRWPKHGPKKMTIARYCGELEKRGFLTRSGTKPTLWRFRVVRQ